jgi:hypothetical protein
MGLQKTLGTLEEDHANCTSTTLPLREQLLAVSYFHVTGWQNWYIPSIEGS